MKTDRYAGWFFSVSFAVALFAAICSYQKQVYLNYIPVQIEEVFRQGVIDTNINYLTSKEAIIKFMGNGNFLVYNRYKLQIKVFDKNLHYLFSFGKKGEGPGEFSGVADMFVDNKDNIYVLDFVQKKIKIFDDSMKYKKSFNIKGAGWYSRLAVDSNGLIYLCNPQSKKLITVYNKEGEEQYSFGKIYTHKRKDALRELNYSSVLFDKDEKLWVINICKPIIRQYSINGKLLYEGRLLSPRIDTIKRHESPIPKTGQYSISFYLTDAAMIDSTKMIIANHDNLIEFDIRAKKINKIYKLPLLKESKGYWIFTSFRIAYNKKDNSVYYSHYFLEKLCKVRI